MCPHVKKNRFDPDLPLQPDEDAQRQNLAEGVAEGELAAFEGEEGAVVAGDGREAGFGPEAEGFADGRQ